MPNGVQEPSSPATGTDAYNRPLLRTGHKGTSPDGIPDVEMQDAGDDGKFTSPAKTDDLGDSFVRNVSLSMGELIIKDLKSNLLVVSLPAVFTNAAWRAMNIGGIAVHETPAMIIVWTTLYIAPVVFVICALVDMFRQLVIMKGDRREYFKKGFRTSTNLGWKFFMGVVGWTVGYEVVAGTHMFYAGTSTAGEYISHGIGSAVGEFFGLLVACEVTHITEFIFTFQHSTAPPTGSLGVATKGTLEAFLWSVVGDANLYGMWGSTVGAAIADSLILGVCAALGFSIMGILTSIFGYYFIHRRWEYVQSLSSH